MAHSNRDFDPQPEAHHDGAPHVGVSRVGRASDWTFGVLAQWLKASAIGMTALMLVPLVLLGPAALGELHTKITTGSWPDNDGFWGPKDFIELVFRIGSPVVLLYGAPAYVILSRRNLVGFWTVSLVGALPGLLVLIPFGDALFSLYGAFVALLTHVGHLLVADPPRAWWRDGRASFRARMAERHARRARRHAAPAQVP